MDPHLKTKSGNRALLELWWETQCSSHMGPGILGTFLSCMKSVKYPFTFPEGTWDFSGDTALEKGLISHEERIL